MRPFSTALNRPAHPGTADEDLDATISFSDSEDEQPDPPALQQLARALLAWEPTLVAAYAPLDHASAELAPFAVFLVRLDKEVDGRTAMRGEIIGWLQALGRDAAARSRAFRIAAAVNSAVSALATYQAIRTASQ
jgi:hypothetical protein